MTLVAVVSGFEDPPYCDFCLISGVAVRAIYDAQLRIGGWAALCQTHFDEFGVGLSPGKAMFILRPKDPR